MELGYGDHPLMQAHTFLTCLTHNNRGSSIVLHSPHLYQPLYLFSADLSITAPHLLRNASMPTARSTFGPMPTISCPWLNVLSMWTVPASISAHQKCPLETNKHYDTKSEENQE